MCVVFIEGGWVGFAAYNAGTGILSVATDVKCPAGQAGDVHAAALCAAQENVARVLCQTTHLSALKDALATRGRPERSSDSSVVLPAPLGPMSAVSEPGWKAQLTLVRICRGCALKQPTRTWTE